MNPLRWLVDFFGFSQKEANGVLVLLLLIFTLAIFPRLHRLTKKPQNDSSDSLLLAEWVISLEAIKAKELEEKPEFKEFNKIQQASDLKTNKWAKQPKTESKSVEAAMPTVRMDINLASAEDLRVVKGIGPVLSERIVKFRERLGGFHNLSQLGEVYGLDTSVVRNVQSHFEITSSNQRTLFINSDSIKTLSNHPYMNYKVAKDIFYYRRTHGDYTDPAQLLSIKGFSDSLYQKIYPYISILPPKGQ